MNRDDPSLCAREGDSFASVPSLPPSLPLPPAGGRLNPELGRAAAESGGAVGADRRALLMGLGGAAAGALLMSARTAQAAGGPINPPAGTVGSTGRTLSEIEPRGNPAPSTASTATDASAAFE